MEPWKYTVVSHADLDYASPIAGRKMEAIVELLVLPAGARVVDFGAGKGELLVRLAQRWGARCTGIERAPPFVEEARSRAATRAAPGAVEMALVEASAFPVEAASLDLAVCIGATEIHGGYTGTLAALAALVRPGGHVLVGEGYWKRPPDDAYLESFGATRDELASHADNVAAGVALGLVPTYSVVASDDDWDDYEWRHCRAVERWAQAHPTDPDAPALLTRIRAWRDLYLRAGRDTLGFALYLFERP